MGRYNARVEMEARTLSTRQSILFRWIVKSVVGVVFGIKVNTLDDEVGPFHVEATAYHPNAMKVGRIHRTGCS